MVTGGDKPGIVYHQPDRIGKKIMFSWKGVYMLRYCVHSKGDESRRKEVACLMQRQELRAPRRPSSISRSAMLSSLSSRTTS